MGTMNVLDMRDWLVFARNFDECIFRFDSVQILALNLI